MANFTPGPWFAAESRAPRTHGLPVAALGDWVIESKSPYHRAGADEDDANLIAAAPELYSVLAELLETNAVRHNNSEQVQRLVKDGLEALAKADGKAGA